MKTDFTEHASSLQRRTPKRYVRHSVLGLLNEGSLHGYAIIGEFDKRMQGVWRPSPGSIYPALATLVEEKLITSSASGKKTVYTITKLGKKELQLMSEKGTLKMPWDIPAEELKNLTNLRETSVRLMIATKEIAKRGNKEEIITAQKKIKKLIADLNGKKEME